MHRAGSSVRDGHRAADARRHARCYGAHQGKAACDTAFLEDMLAICAKLPSSGSVNSSFTRASCRAAAHLYYKGVVVGGGLSYCHRPVCREGE